MDYRSVLNNQRFQMALNNAIKVSGVAALPIVQKWCPTCTADSISGDIIMAAPFLIGFAIEWYRNHPDNILARARKVINGGAASPEAVAAIVKEANK
jgi:hypothetical protein